MVTFIYFLYAVIHLGLVIWGFKQFQQNRKRGIIWLLMPLIGLVYDNSVIGAGQFIGVGSLLESLNYPRFVLHAMGVPFWIVGSFALVQWAEIGWAKTQGATIVVWLITIGLIILGTFELSHLHLGPLEEAGVIRYTNLESSAPIPAISTILLVILFGIILWVKRKWPWLAIIGILTFIGNGVAVFIPFGFALGNAVEILMGFGLLLTGQHLSNLQFTIDD